MRKRESGRTTAKTSSLTDIIEILFDLRTIHLARFKRIYRSIEERIRSDDVLNLIKCYFFVGLNQVWSIANGFVYLDQKTYVKTVSESKLFHIFYLLQKELTEFLMISLRLVEQFYE